MKEHANISEERRLLIEDSVAEFVESGRADNAIIPVEIYAGDNYVKRIDVVATTFSLLNGEKLFQFHEAKVIEEIAAHYGFRLLTAQEAGIIIHVFGGPILRESGQKVLETLGLEKLGFGFPAKTLLHQEEGKRASYWTGDSTNKHTGSEDDKACSLEVAHGYAKLGDEPADSWRAIIFTLIQEDDDEQLSFL